MWPNRQKRGVSSSEFAMWLPVLLLLIGGAIDLSWYMVSFMSVSRGAREGCRWGAAIRRPLASDDGIPRQEDFDQLASEAEEYAKDVLDEAMANIGLSDCGDSCTVNARGYWDADTQLWWLRVEVTYDSPQLFGILPFLEDELETQFEMVTQLQGPAP